MSAIKWQLMRAGVMYALGQGERPQPLADAGRAGHQRSAHSAEQAAPAQSAAQAVAEPRTEAPTTAPAAEVKVRAPTEACHP